MGTITRLVQGKKNPNRVNVYIDGQFALALSIDEVVKNGLKKGQEIDETKLSELRDVDATGKAYDKILNFLSYRPRTVKEVRDRLYQYEIRDVDKQNSLIKRLAELGYLDDLKFAQWFIESRNTHRPRSIRYLSQELSSKGVSKDIIRDLTSHITGEDETIKQLLAKKLGTNRSLSMVERQKIYSYLGRLGFAWDKIAQVVKNWESE